MGVAQGDKVFASAREVEYVCWEVGRDELAVVGTAPGVDCAGGGEDAEGGPGGGDGVECWQGRGQWSEGVFG